MVFRVGRSHRFVGINRSGLLIVRGANSISSARAALRDAARLAVRSRKVRLAGLRIQNIVATTDLCQKLNLEEIALARAFDGCTYEPELFPGLVARFPGTRCTILLFASGKCVVVGARSLLEIRRRISETQTMISRL